MQVHNTTAQSFYLMQEIQEDSLETVVDSQCPVQSSAVSVVCIDFNTRNRNKEQPEAFV